MPGLDPEPISPAGIARINEVGHRKLPAPLIINNQLYWYVPNATVFPDDTEALWPWPGQWSTNVFRVTLGDIRK